MWTLVTGGAKHLGAAICLDLARQGRSVVVHYNHSHKEALEIVDQCVSLGGKAAAIQGSFSTMASTCHFVQRYLQQFPQTIALINNVGAYQTKSALNTTVEEWNELFQVNLHTPFILSRALIPSLMECRGQVINVGTSGLKTGAARTYASAYFLTKQGLWGLTLSLARELAPHGVRVNMVSPGQLDISVDLPKDLNQLPMHRTVHFSEVCRVIRFLLDPSSDSIMGQNIEVAGGVGLQ